MAECCARGPEYTASDGKFGYVRGPARRRHHGVSTQPSPRLSDLVSLPEKTPLQTREEDKRSLGQGLFRKCDGCGLVLASEQFTDHFEVCTSCGHHHPMGIAGWCRLLLDDGALDLWGSELRSADPLEFHDGRAYTERLAKATQTTQESDAIRVGQASIAGVPVGFGCFAFSFMGGSMGSVVGERIALLFEGALERGLPVVLVHASGGARMQEGILSLMQMAKGVAALSRLRDAKLPYISLCIHPTTGGVAASTALLGDVNIAEPNALVGFAGARVIENTIKAKLPEGFQRSEFLLEHGMVDQVVPRAELKQSLRRILGILMGGRRP